MSFSEKLFYNFSRLFHCSIIKVLAICFRLESLIFPRKTDCFLCFRFVVSLPRQQILSYQIISCLSTLFLTFFILLFKVSVASTSYILSNGSSFVNTFFHIFCIFFKSPVLWDFPENKTKNFPPHIYAAGNSFAIPSYFSNFHEEI